MSTQLKYDGATGALAVALLGGNSAVPTPMGFRQASVSIAGGAGDQTALAAEYVCPYIELNGAITGDRNYLVPALPGLYVLYNNTTGAHAIAVKTAAGTGITVAQTKRAILYCDSVNVVRLGADQ